MRAALALPAFVLALASAQATAAPGPADVVKQIYRIAAGPKGDYQSCDKAPESECSLDGARIRALLTRSLAALLADMNARSEKINEPILDFDPISDSQDPFIDRLDIKAGPKADDGVAVRFYSAKGAKAPRHDLRYLMKLEDGAWRVDDIVGEGKDGWDLRKIAASNG